MGDHDVLPLRMPNSDIHKSLSTATGFWPYVNSIRIASFQRIEPNWGSRILELYVLN